MSEVFLLYKVCTWFAVEKMVHLLQEYKKKADNHSNTG
jgi:hypothetical protein